MGSLGKEVLGLAIPQYSERSIDVVDTSSQGNPRNMQVDKCPLLRY